MSDCENTLDDKASCSTIILQLISKYIDPNDSIQSCSIAYVH